MFSSSKKLSASSLPSLRDETSRVHAHAQSPGRGAAIALQFGATHEPRVAAEGPAHQADAMAKPAYPRRKPDRGRNKRASRDGSAL